MSLLMKALEKAAKDREETGAERTPAAPAGAAAQAVGAAKPELTLEPITAETAAAAAPIIAGPREPVLSPSPRKPAGGAPAAPAAAAAAAAAAAPRESAQAATVIRAGQRARTGGIGAYAREHPLIVFGTLAALFLIGYGSYIYLQMTNPGLFIKAPPQSARPAPVAPVAQAPAPTEGGVNPAAPLATTSLLPAMQEVAPKDKPAPQAPTAAGATAAPVATGPAASAAVQAPAEPAPASPRDTIKVTTGDAAPTINPLLAEGYAALTAGNLDSAQRLYNQLLRSDPGNIDARLGLAAIATQQGDRGAATQHYMKVLELDPRNSLAKANLIGMFGRADPEAESRLKQLIAREPSPYLHFTLGNLYADRSQWAQAQQEYFRAYQLQPDNPDYAYNLAVALEHISQPKLALDYYRRAAQFAAARGRANFSTAAAQERISKLETIAQ